MLYLVDPSRSHHPFSLWPWHNLPHLVFHDGVILLNHSLLPHIMLCNFLETRRFRVNQLRHQSHIAKSIWWFSPPHGALWKSHMSGILKCGPKPLRLWPSVYLLRLLDILLLLQLILQVNDQRIMSTWLPLTIRTCALCLYMYLYLWLLQLDPRVLCWLLMC